MSYSNSFSIKELESFAHPKESSRFLLAALICIPIAIGFLFLTFASYGVALLFVGTIIFMIWFGLSIMEANLKANSVKVSSHNFPFIQKIVDEVKSTLNYKKDVDVFIVEQGSVNALLGKFFNKKFIVLHSALVEEMRNDRQQLQLKWIVGRFIGALKIKQVRFDLLKVIIESIEEIKLFNLFILPYERATQYSGDNIGLIVCEDLPQAMIAFDKFMVGNKLADQINFVGVLDQSQETKGSFFSFLARLFSTHPHTVDRYLNLLAFARAVYPEQFRGFISNLQYNQIDLGRVLPNNYQHLRPVNTSDGNFGRRTISSSTASSSTYTNRPKIKIQRRD